MARRTHAQIVADIRAFTPPDEWEWDGLDVLLTELREFGRPTDAIPDLLTLYERFPAVINDWLWEILHWLESLPGYQPHLARSVVRKPSRFGVSMLGRMLNSGITDIEGQPIYPMLQAVADNPDLPGVIRETATGFMNRHPHLRPPTAVQHDTPTRKRKR